MHFTFPFSSTFLLALFSGSILSITSSNWISIWLGLEVNLMAFLPMIMATAVTQETESAIKYFLIQALGSGLLLFGGLSSSFFLFSSTLSLSFLMLGLSLKLGAAPVHFWLPPVMAGLSWLNCLVLTTWQKLAPLFLLLSVTSSLARPLIIIAAMSSLVGGVGGMNQISLRALLAYSSIGHIGWLLATLQLSMKMLMIYFFIYITIVSPMFLSLWFMSTSQYKQITSIEKWPTQFLMGLTALLLSLSGIPPLTGFLSKWLVIQSLMPLSIPLTVFLIIGSLMSLYYYLILFLALTSRSMPQDHLLHLNFSTPTPQLFLFSLSVPLMGLGMLSIL